MGSPLWPTAWASLSPCPPADHPFLFQSAEVRWLGGPGRQRLRLVTTAQLNAGAPQPAAAAQLQGYAKRTKLTDLICIASFFFAFSFNLSRQEEYRLRAGGDDDVATRLVVTSGKMVLLDKLLKRLHATGHRCGLGHQNKACLFYSLKMVCRLLELLKRLHATGPGGEAGLLCAASHVNAARVCARPLASIAGQAATKVLPTLCCHMSLPLQGAGVQPDGPHAGHHQRWVQGHSAGGPVAALLCAWRTPTAQGTSCPQALPLHDAPERETTPPSLLVFLYHAHLLRPRAFHTSLLC